MYHQFKSDTTSLRVISKNLINIKGNSSSFGFVIKELSFEEANKTVIIIIPLRVLFTFSFVLQRLSEKPDNLKFEICFYLEISQQSK